MLRMQLRQKRVVGVGPVKLPLAGDRFRKEISAGNVYFIVYSLTLVQRLALEISLCDEERNVLSRGLYSMIGLSFDARPRWYKLQPWR